MDREQWIAEAMRLVNEFGQMRESAGGSAAVFARKAANAERQQADETAHQIFAHLRTLPAPAAGVPVLSDEQIEVELRWLRRNNGMDGMTSEYRDRLVAQHFLAIAASPDLAPPHEGEPDAILKRGRYAVGGTYWDVLVLNQDLPDGTPLYTHPAPAQGERDARLTEVLMFLRGEGSLDGLWFGDEAADGRPKYWWRTHLRAAMSSEGSKKP